MGTMLIGKICASNKINTTDAETDLFDIYDTSVSCLRIILWWHILMMNKIYYVTEIV